MRFFVERLGWAIAGALALALVAIAAGLAGAGPLDPTGSPGSTRPRVEPRHPVPPDGWNGTFPITLDQPGSYFLTDDIYKPIDTPPAIVITESHVTLDLNGFSVRQRGCSGGDTTPLILVSGLALLRNITLEHGTVDGACGSGIKALNGANPVETAVDGLVLRDLQITNSGGGGNSFEGAGVDANLTLRGLIEDVTVRFNIGIGIQGASGMVIRDCVASQNGRYGVLMQGYGTVSNCAAEGNGQHGFFLGSAASLNDCSAAFNGGDGVNAFDQSVIDGCATWGNQGAGIVAGQDASVTDCSAVSNVGDGVRVGQRSAVRGCAANNNGASGIVAGLDSVVSASTASDNSEHGIRARSSYVFDSQADGNGAAIPNGAGILVDGTAPGARIEGNNVSVNDIGIAVTAPASNVIVRNSATANTTEFSIPGGNVAPIETAATLANPWANIDY